MTILGILLLGSSMFGLGVLVTMWAVFGVGLWLGEDAE